MALSVQASSKDTLERAPSPDQTGKIDTALTCETAQDDTLDGGLNAFEELYFFNHQVDLRLFVDKVARPRADHDHERRVGARFPDAMDECERG